MKILASICALLVLATPLRAEIDIAVAYLESWRDRPPTLSNLDAVPEDEGLRGAELGIEDNATTGRFLNHSYSLEPFIAEEGGFLEVARSALAHWKPGALRLLAAVFDRPPLRILSRSSSIHSEWQSLHSSGAPY